MLLKIIIIFCTIFHNILGILRCSKINKSLQFDFYIMQTCTLSNQNVIARTFASDLEYCKNFSRRLKGLSFNYAVPGLCNKC